MLSNDELFHFAVDASVNARHDVAIKYLKELTNKEPDHLDGLYLIGAEYAQVGLYDLAIDFMQKALTVNPELRIANFQLGLLFMSTDRYNEAKETWSIIHSDNENDYLSLFSEGLTSLVDNNSIETKRLLTMGIEKNLENVALNNDMQNVLDSLSEIVSDTAIIGENTDCQPDVEDEYLNDNNTLFLSAYKNTKQ